MAKLSGGWSVKSDAGVTHAKAAIADAALAHANAVIE